jgi:hypothetical protein
MRHWRRVAWIRDIEYCDATSGVRGDSAAVRAERKRRINAAGIRDGSLLDGMGPVSDIPDN